MKKLVKVTMCLLVFFGAFMVYSINYTYCEIMKTQICLDVAEPSLKVNCSMFIIIAILTVTQIITLPLKFRNSELR